MRMVTDRDRGAAPGRIAAALAEARVDPIALVRDGSPSARGARDGRGVRLRQETSRCRRAKAGKSLSISVIAALDIVIAGGVVVVLDRENGPEEYARRLASVLQARGAGEQLRERLAENLHYYAWPPVRLDWGKDPDYPLAFAGADLVVWDSARRFLTAVGLTEDSSDDFATFAEALIDPLMRAGIATAILDNTGHGAKDRARGSSSKGDLADLVYVLRTVEEFEPKPGAGRAPVHRIAIRRDSRNLGARARRAACTATGASRGTPTGARSSSRRA